MNHREARKEAEYLMNGVFDPDREPVSGLIEKAIRASEDISELCAALEDAAKNHYELRRCLTNLLAEWLEE